MRHLFRVLLTHLARQTLGASGVFARDCVKEIHPVVSRRAAVARTGLVPALERCGPAIPTTHGRRGFYWSLIVRVFEGTAVVRVCGTVVISPSALEADHWYAGALALNGLAHL